MLADWDELLPRFVKVMPHDYKRALAELAAESDTVYYHDDHPTSSRGEGFVTTETEEPEPAETSGVAWGAAAHSSSSRGSRGPSAIPASASGDYREFVGTLPGRRACRSRARAAWSAACRSATTAARSTT